ncbi:hypothetical protein GCM10009551_034070 [Nocardiopsis tropica]
MTEDLHAHDSGVQHPHDPDRPRLDQLAHSGANRRPGQADSVGQRLERRSAVPLQRAHKRGVNRIKHDGAFRSHDAALPPDDAPSCGQIIAAVEPVHY